MATRIPDTIEIVTTQSLSAAANDRGRSALRALIAARWAGKQSAAASALGVKEPTISYYLSGRKGAGGKLIGAVATIDPFTALAMSGAMPRVPHRVIPWCTMVAASLSASGIPADIAGWAALQTLYLGKPESPDSMLASARILALAAQMITSERPSNLLPDVIERSRNAG